MKPVLFLFFLFTVSYSALAQDTIAVQQNELIHLQNAIKEHSQKDSVLVQLLIDYANLCFYDLDFLDGLKAINEARSISKELNYSKGEGLYLKSISIFRKRISEGNVFIKNPNVARINAGNEFINNLDIYYEVEGNRILGQYTDFDVFGNISMPTGQRDSEIETMVSSLEEALSYYSEKENVEITAYLHEGLSLLYFKSDKEKSNEHKRVAEELYQELKLSYHQLLILVNEINYFLGQGLEAEAKPLEIEAINIYSKEADKYIKAHGAFLLSRTYGMHNRLNLQLEYLFQAEELLSDIGEKDLIKSIYLSAASVYEWYFTNSEKALEYEYKELYLRKEINYFESVAYTYLLISESLFGLKKIQDFPAEYQDYLKLGGIEGQPFFDAELLWIKARMLQSQGRSEEARIFNYESIENYNKANDFNNGPSWNCFDLAQSYMGDGEYEKAIEYASEAYDLGSKIIPLHY
ncbi:MAG: hypothetical protein U5K79_01555 [Cyclobacteriaceae bacterium]|nr:hypothetical protein [Cyclobacteriaceae bacterium]